MLAKLSDSVIAYVSLHCSSRGSFLLCYWEKLLWEQWLQPLGWSLITLCVQVICKSTPSHFIYFCVPLRIFLKGHLTLICSVIIVISLLMSTPITWSIFHGLTYLWRLEQYSNNNDVPSIWIFISPTRSLVCSCNLVSFSGKQHNRPTRVQDLSSIQHDGTSSAAGEHVCESASLCLLCSVAADLLALLTWSANLCYLSAITSLLFNH
jgi:hypothetical protein